MKTTVRGYIVLMVVAALGLWAPALRAALTEVLQLAETLPAPVKLAADSPFRQRLTAESLLAGPDRGVALEKAFLAEWGRGPMAVDLETAEGRVRWGELSREGALSAHLRWLTLPANSKEAIEARTDARQRTILALLCVPEDTAAIHMAKQHPWFRESAGQGEVSGDPGAFTQKLEILLAGRQANDSAPPENGEELSALLTEVMPLAEGTIDLANVSPGIAAAVAGRVTDVVGRLRMKRQKDVAFIASALAKFVWECTSDPARAMDVTDWGDAQQQMPFAQVRYAFQPPAGLEQTPLGRHVAALDKWVWNGAEAETEPVTPAPWAKIPSVVWRHALGSGGAPGNFKRLMEANRRGAWGMSLSVSSSAGQAVQLLDKRLGDKVVSAMNGPAAAEWFSVVTDIGAMLKEPGVSPEVRARLGKQLDLHRAQVLIASGQRELAKKELPASVAQLDAPPSGPGGPRMPREEQGAGLATRARERQQRREKEELDARVAAVEQEKAEKKRLAQETEEARKPKPAAEQKFCWTCNGHGGEYQKTLLDPNYDYKRLEGSGVTRALRTYDAGYVSKWVKCEKCDGKGYIETQASK